ncbi:hypothetical protein CDL60_09660 [Roseateles noduli]|nr:hypothetical protein CDL60_09660 [Roseateles noduli]
MGDALISMRDRLTHLTALLQDFDVPMEMRRKNGTLCDIAVDLIHEVTCYFALVEIAMHEDHNRQVKRSVEAN